MKAFLHLLLSILFILPVNAQISKEISVETKKGSLYGTLLVPNEDTETIALIIAESGPTDRNGNNPMGVSASSYKLLAEGLSKNGIASLRYDKRGIGKSKEASIPEKDVIFENFVQDAVSWLELLKKDKNYKKIVVIGHSEGSLIGMIAAKETNVNAYVSLSGAGSSADKVLKTQLESQPEQLKNEAFRIIDSLKIGVKIDTVHPFLGSLFRYSIQPYLINWFQFDPSIEIQKLSIPTLIINGNTDIQVGPENAELLHKSNTKSRLVILNKMNHVLKVSEKDLQSNMATYKDAGLQLHEDLVPKIVEFLNSEL